MNHSRSFTGFLSFNQLDNSSFARRNRLRDGHDQARLTRDNGASQFVADPIFQTRCIRINFLFFERQTQGRPREAKVRTRRGNRCFIGYREFLSPTYDVGSSLLLNEPPLSTVTQFSAQIERLANYHATAHPPPSTSATHALERHRSVLADYQRERIRTQVRILVPLSALLAVSDSTCSPIAEESARCGR